MRRVVIVVLLSGCSSILGIEDFKVGDGGTTGGEMMEQGYCLGPMGWRVCVDAMPTMPRMVDSSLNFDTSNSPLCANPQTAMWASAGQPDACFIVASSVTFSAPSIQGIGVRPLVIFASDTITISSQLDVGSHLIQGMTTRGAGSPAMACVAPMMAGSSSSGAGGGGAGGSFTTKGGDGGNSSTTGVVGGRAAAADSAGPAVLRAGCSGGKGGDGGDLGGAPGVGGGAVYLVAGNRIVINGFINASGSAGIGGNRLGGGGGGGSGGMIHLHAPMIGGNGSGVLVANGGGAGEGGDPNNPGLSGSDPVPGMPAMTPLGGNGPSVGGAGGNGFVFNPPNVTMATAGGAGVQTTAAGGGGGGGGGGFIRANVMPSQVVASPAITVIATP